MNENKNYIKIAQSASALGAGILGFGLGARWGNVIADYAFIVIVAGALLHVWGMYVMQMRKDIRKANAVAKVLWISAWLCLIALVVITIYLVAGK
jgi:hypothetical protein